MAVDQILIDAGPGETRVAFCEGGRLSELWVDRAGQGRTIGNIYLGRVAHVALGIAAAFVDIGLERAGFLALAEARPAGTGGETPNDRISDYLSEGDAVLVQVQREPTADKGAKLTTRVGLTGRFAVFLPGSAEIHLSRRIDGSTERERLEGIARASCREGEGMLVRTAAFGAAAADIEADVERLRILWRDIQARRAERQAPSLLWGERGAAARALRDVAGPAVREVVVSDEGLLARLRREAAALSPDLADRLRAHTDRLPLFEAFGVEEAIDAALAPRVALSSGGSLIIEETAALVAIDVNTGGRMGGGPEDAALAANLEAADEIARQIRLRNLAGQFAVDFVPMKRRVNQTAVLDALRVAVADDGCPTHVFGFTRLGLVEMTRQRRSPSLRETLCETCVACDGAGSSRGPLTQGLDALRRALRVGHSDPGATVEVTAPAAVVAALQGPAAAALGETRERLGGALTLRKGGDAEPIDIHCHKGRPNRA